MEAAEAEVATDTIPEISDSLRHILDSTHRADSIAARDSLELLKKSSLEAPAFTTARDSVVEDFSDGKRIIYYYGDVSVTYGNMKLTADYMEYDLATSTLYARGTKEIGEVADSVQKIVERILNDLAGADYFAFSNLKEDEE